MTDEQLRSDAAYRYERMLAEINEWKARAEASEKDAMKWKRAVGDERRRHKDPSIKEVIDRIIRAALEAKP